MAMLAQRNPSRGNITAVEAQSIIRSHQQAAPINVGNIATDLGLRIYGAQLPQNISGKIFYEEPSESPTGYVIYVNQAEQIERQRFTAAHEIAHFILHRDLIGDGIADDVLYRSKLSSPQETEANNLAADILMPWHLISELQTSGVTDVREMANRFQVSLTAMSVRLGMPT
jgi:Zn-dependent peptidase ImmA (M78 family)